MSSFTNEFSSTMDTIAHCCAIRNLHLHLNYASVEHEEIIPNIEVCFAAVKFITIRSTIMRGISAIIYNNSLICHLVVTLLTSRPLAIGDSTSRYLPPDDPICHPAAHPRPPCYIRPDL